MSLPVAMRGEFERLAELPQHSFLGLRLGLETLAPAATCGARRDLSPDLQSARNLQE
jgi:hypothetical protein